MRFIDEVTCHLVGGRGGDGSISFRREAMVPKGGPDGGSGGDGGSVIFVASSSVNTLIDLSFQSTIKAGHGESGTGCNKNGRTGKNKIVEVPPGTQVYWGDKLIADLALNDSRWVAAKGGKGGRGNACFTTSRNQTPSYAERGVPGQSVELRLILKSVANVGLVGLPNAGKSTLISAISAARPQIADYAFTTLKPNLGVVRLGQGRSFVVADIPGIIPDAHLGKGLGIQFLRHIERTSTLAILLDPSQVIDPQSKTSRMLLPEEYCALSDEELRRNVIEQYEALAKELECYSAELGCYPRLVVFSKADLTREEANEPNLAEHSREVTADFFAERDVATYVISSSTNVGLDELCEALYSLTREVCSGDLVATRNDN